MNQQHDPAAEAEPAGVTREIDALESSQRRLTEHLTQIDPVDPATPTALPAWTVGHVLTHIARNADSVLRMLAGLPQYWKGRESRNADIELGAGRSWNELVDDVVTTSEAILGQMRAVADWGGTIRSTAGERPKSALPSMRRREVEVHRIDLGLGYGFADLPRDFVAAELRTMGMLWASRQPMGLTALPAPVLALPEHERLAWFFGRRSVDGVDPAGIL